MRSGYCSVYFLLMLEFLGLVLLPLQCLEPTFSEPKFKRDRFRLALEGAPLRNYRVEVSWDQLSWSEVITTNSPSGRFIYVDHTPLYSSHRFYRALLVGNADEPNSSGTNNSPLPINNFLPLDREENRAPRADRANSPASAVMSTSESRSFTNASPLAIPAFGSAPPYPSTIAVTGLSLPISKLTVTLSDLTHTHPDDLDVLLVAPAGQSVLLMSDAGGGLPIDHATLIFDDAASLEQPDETQMISSTE